MGTVGKLTPGIAYFIWSSFSVVEKNETKGLASGYTQSQRVFAFWPFLLSASPGP